ncbi:protein FANTASTIC FOUR 3-like [Vigna unguiculata]|uniref:The fantastic four family n=1 Tax=Vigna unguiculata TaxID=3917 RepID=A0A4D6N509_VIGUN|nr:protein FANTASTIC FOUR 3-like [Vigna unguiculata]QCE08368.1 The fantastic four family [Vigna unguiculata]
MAAIVCHGLQSHSQLAESIALKLRLPASKPNPPQFFKSSFWDSNSNSNSTFKPHTEENNNSTPRTPSNPTSSWTFLEALSNVSKQPSQEQTTYVHPHQKRSSLTLSPRSLQLCTENLGNESGSDSDESSIDMLSAVSTISGTREQTQEGQTRQLSTARKAKAQNFPPPLTTIRGSEPLRVRPHRENGRLVIEVTKVPPSPLCFKAERSHGRLRLCFLTNPTPSFDPEEEDDAEENEVLTNEKELENEIIGRVKDTEEEEDEETEEEETGDEKEEEDEEEENLGEECAACGCVESDVIVEKYERLRRCREGGDHENNELLNWSDSLCVVTS